MTEIIDEFFEHPVPRNDDILDALYYADYYARAPRSTAMGVEAYEKEGKKKGTVKKYYNWLTGAKI